MKKILTVVIGFSLLAASSAMLETVPLTMTYQGRLTDNAGTPLNGTFDMIVRIYDDSTSGQLIEEFSFPNVTVVNGTFDVQPHTSGLAEVIGNDVMVSLAITRFLEIEVEGEIITPRVRLTSSPFSMLSNRVAGDIFTSPGRIYMVPGPPVQDCTYVPLEMAVDSVTTRIRLKLFNPAPPPPSEPTYAPLELKVDANITQMHLWPPQPVLPVDSVEPAIEFSVDAANSIFQLFGIDPEPFRANHREAEISLMADAVFSSILLQHPGNGVEQPPSLRMKTGLGSGLELVGFNPQPEPPKPWFSLSANEMGGASLQMFNSEVDPGPINVPAVQINGGSGALGPSFVMIDPGPINRQTGTSMEFSMVQVNPGPVNDQEDNMISLMATPGSGSSLVMLNPQPFPPSPAEPWLSLSTDVAMGASLQMFNSEVDPGPTQVPAVQINGGSSGINPCIMVYDTKTGPAGETKTSTAELMVNGNTESLLDLHHNGDAGIEPCVRAAAEPYQAHLNIVANHPPDPLKTAGLGRQIASSSDSAYVNIIADTNSARIEIFGRAAGGAGATPAVFLKADNSGGRVGINTVNPTEELHVVGDICASGTIGACSDERYKKDIETITNALVVIEKIRGVDFKWRTDEFPEQKFSEEEQVGFIAQEIKEVLPEVVSQGSDGFYSVDYSRLTPVLVEAVKEQQKTIETLSQRLERLEKVVQEMASVDLVKKVEVASK